MANTRSLIPIQSSEKGRELAKRRAEIYKRAVLLGMKEGTGKKTVAEAIAALSAQLAREIMDGNPRSDSYYRVLMQYGGIVQEEERQMEGSAKIMLGAEALKQIIMLIQKVREGEQLMGGNASTSHPSDDVIDGSLVE